MPDHIPRLERADRRKQEPPSFLQAILSIVGLELAFWIILGLIAVVAMSA